MWKSLLFTICLFSAYANVPIGKVEYLIELMNMKSRFIAVRKDHTAKLKKTYSIGSENLSRFEKIYEKYYGWNQMKGDYINYLQKEFNEEEVNKLLAVYELNEAKKMMRLMSTGDDQFIQNFLNSSNRLKDFNQEFNLLNRPF